MADWHGYPQAKRAHPERPWWRCVRVFQELLWRRTDGAVIEDIAGDCSTAELARPNLAAYDAAHPLPPPEPRCGQVWVWEKGDRRVERSVTAVHWTWQPAVYWGDMAMNRYGGGDIGDGDEWPPPGAVLVAGPGAPWAPMGADAGTDPGHNHWSDDISRADADEIASALGLELEYDADDGLEALKAHAATLAAEHAALRRQVEELRYAAGSWHKAAQRGADQERARCLAWVERLIAVWADPEQAAMEMSLRDVADGITGDEWPPSHD